MWTRELLGVPSDEFGGMGEGVSLGYAAAVTKRQIRSKL
jgi:hypothetical protein